jgi:hypothetical protein
MDSQLKKSSHVEDFLYGCGAREVLREGSNIVPVRDIIPFSRGGLKSPPAILAV